MQKKKVFKKIIEAIVFTAVAVATVGGVVVLFAKVWKFSFSNRFFFFFFAYC